MATTTEKPSRDELEARDRHAWSFYGELCHCATATDKDRRGAFDAAMACMTVLADHDRYARREATA